MKRIKLLQSKEQEKLLNRRIAAEYARISKEIIKDNEKINKKLKLEL